jgi:TP901 family phage tail tape measure protein
MAIDFDKSMTHIRALVGASDAQMKQYRASVLKMATDTGRGPKELAEALYFVTSSGFKGAAAMKVLDASAHAAMAGLGETKVIADVVTSALSAYGQKNLSAAKATDIMLAAVREGKNEPEELAGSIGHVIPVAQAMGVSFGEVAGTIAALSLNGTNANEAVTQIVAGLAQAIKPTKQGAAALKTLGMTYKDLRGEIKDKGMIEVFNDLKKAFGGDVEMIGQVFGNIRALRGVMTLTGVSAEKYAGIVKRVSAAHGDLAVAAAKAEQSPGVKLEKALAKLKVMAIDIGVDLIPAVLGIASAVGKVAEAFSGLSDRGKKVVLILLGVAALSGPILQVAASIAAIKTAAVAATGGMSAIASMAGRGIAALRAMSTASKLCFVGMGVAVGAAIVGLEIWQSKMNEVNEQLDKSIENRTNQVTQISDTARSDAKSLANIATAKIKDQMFNVSVKTNGTGDLTNLQEKLDLLARFKKIDYPGLENLVVGIRTNKIQGAQLVDSFRSIKGEIMTQLNMTTKQADKLLTEVFGKKYTMHPPKMSAADLREMPTQFERATRTIINTAKKGGKAAAKNLIAGYTSRGMEAPVSLAGARVAAAFLRKLKGLPADVRKLGAEAAKAIGRGEKVDTKNIDKALLEMGMKSDVLKRRLASLSKMKSTPMVRLQIKEASGDLAKVTAKYKALSKIKIAAVTAPKVKSADAKGKQAAAELVRGWLTGTPAARTAGTTVGSALAAGAASGIANGSGPVAAAATRMVEQALAAAKRAADVKSPSKKTMQLGLNIGAGLGIGIAKSTAGVAKASMTLTGVVITTVKQAVKVAAAIAKALSGFKSKKTKKVKSAAEVAGPIGELLDFVVSSTEALHSISTMATYSLNASAKRAVAKLVKVSVQVAAIIANGLNKAFPAAKGKKKKGGKKRARLLSGAALVGPVGEIFGVVTDTMDMLKAMTEIDPRMFEVPAGAFERVAAIISRMADTMSASLSKVVVTDAVLTAADRLKNLAESLLAVLEVMRGVAEVDAGGFGTAGWTNLMSAAGGMVNAASVALPGVSSPAASSGSLTVQVSIGQVNATNPTQAENAGAAIAASVISKLATGKRRTGRVSVVTA